jgi:hypothetical protein
MDSKKKKKKEAYEIGRNIGESNRQRPNHDCYNVSAIHGRQDWVSWPMAKPSPIDRYTTKLETLSVE